jgi:predicted CopG family antitoxin
LKSFEILFFVYDDDVHILKHLKSKNKSVSIITESLNSKKKQDSNTDAGTMLDENNIL